MKKVLLIQGSIPHYRLPIFNSLANNIDISLTIAHSGKSVINCDFEEIIVPSFSLFGFKWQSGVFALAKHYDVVIAEFDLHWISSIQILFFNKSKFVYWGIGKGRKNFVNLLRKYLYSIVDSLILYTDNDVKYFDKGSADKIFIANNTLYINNCTDCSSHAKNSFIFVGTLYPGKGLDKLIDAYSKLVNCSYKLVIVGDGSEADILKKKVKELKLDSMVEFKGFVSDNNILLSLYRSAICSISPNQAGLSVLQSFAFGIPFITKVNAYSGGEKFNIIDNVTGLFYDNDDCLVKYLQLAIDDENLFLKMGHNSYNHFIQNRTVENMVSGFLASINFVTSKN